jgi:hypothetical protein
MLFRAELLDVGDDRRSALIGVAVAIAAGVTPVMVRMRTRVMRIPRLPDRGVKGVEGRSDYEFW